MAEEEGSSGSGWAAFWTTIQKELQSPWDWAAACAGAAGGLATSAMVLHTDGGACAGGGALAAVSARKGVAAAFRGRSLRRRTLAFLEVMSRDRSDPEIERIIRATERDLQLVKNKVLSVADYEKLFLKYVEQYQLAIDSALMPPGAIDETTPSPRRRKRG